MAPFTLATAWQTGAAHGDSGVDVLPCGLVVVTRETFGGIDFGGEKDGMLVKVGSSRRSEKQQDDSSQECGKKNEAMGRVREWHGSPFVESEDSVCRSLAFLHVLFIVDAKNDCASKRRIRSLQAWFTLRTIFNTWAQETVHNCSN